LIHRETVAGTFSGMTFDNVSFLSPIRLITETPLMRNSDQHMITVTPKRT